MNSSILFIAPMKKMILSWDIPIVTRLHRKMGENTDRRNGTVSDSKGNYFLMYALNRGTVKFGIY